MHPNTIKRTNTWVKIPMRGIRYVNCEKFRCDFMAQTCALIAPVQLILHRVSCSNETLPNAPKTKKCSKTWVLGPMGWTGCIRCEKFWCDFKAQTCAWIAPVQPILHQVSCSNESLTKAPKHYETHQNMSLGSNWVHSLRKLPMRFHATNLCINSTISAHFASSFVQ